MASQLKDWRWFSGAATVGIVQVVCPYEGRKYYIGVGNGVDDKADAEHIAAWGAHFPTAVGDLIFGVKND